MVSRYGMVFLGCGLAACLTGCSSSMDDSAFAEAGQLAEAKTAVTLAPVVVSDVTAKVELVGSLISRRRSVIISEVDGVILEIPAAETERIQAEIDGRAFSATSRLDIGMEVAKGDVLVRLDPTEYRLKYEAAVARRNTTERELENLLAWRRPEEIAQAEATRDEAAARLVLAEADLDRARKLRSRDAFTEADYDRTQMQFKVAKAAQERADAELKLANTGPTDAEIAVGKAAIAQTKAEVSRAAWELEKTTIRAPYDGVITDRYVDQGDRVTAMPRVEIMELMDLSVLSAQLSVPERYINRIRVGDPAEVFVKGSAAPVRGLVVLINDKVDPAGRTFRIRVGVDNDERRYKVGQFVRVALQVERSTNALSVPAEAIVYRGGEARVFVCRQGRVRQQAVQLGLSNDAAAEVLSGLVAGERVVVDDPSVLSDGMSVAVRSTQLKENPSASTP